MCPVYRLSNVDLAILVIRSLGINCFVNYSRNHHFLLMQYSKTFHKPAISVNK
jgi:hypothetical protein